MKRFVLVLTILALGFVSSAQLNPVTWSFSVKKTGEKTYEFRAKATIQPGWHLYSQDQPNDAIAIPTEFVLHTNPILKWDGKFKEIGKMEKFHDKKLDLSAHQYSNTVDFVQEIKLKANVKTNISGTVEYQTCDDVKCLPPKTVNFSVAVK